MVDLRHEKYFAHLCPDAESQRKFKRMAEVLHLANFIADIIEQVKASDFDLHGRHSIPHRHIYYPWITKSLNAFVESEFSNDIKTVSTQPSRRHIYIFAFGPITIFVEGRTFGGYGNRIDLPSSPIVTWKINLNEVRRFTECAA